MNPSQSHIQCGPSDHGAPVDYSLAYRLGSSVLNSLPIYGRFRPNPSANHDVDGKVVSPVAGVRTPPPGYYDSSVLTEGERWQGEEGSICSSTAAQLDRGYESTTKRFSPVKTETDTATVVVEDTPSEGSNEGTQAPTGDHLPDTGTRQFLKSFGSLLKTLGGEAPATDMISSWLPNALGVMTIDLEESSGVGPSLIVDHGHHEAPVMMTTHGECSCFQCFQQQQLYLLWLQSRGQSHASAHSYHQNPLQHLPSQQMICASCQRPPLPPRRSKPLLHRFTAALILQAFTFAFIIYPHLKTLFITSYAWERRNHITEKVLTTVLMLSESVWLWVLWLFDGTVGGLEGLERRRSEIDEQRVRKWAVKASGEVLGGIVDGMQMGMSVWGNGRKGKGRVVVVE